MFVKIKCPVTEYMQNDAISTSYDKKLHHIGNSTVRQRLTVCRCKVN